jgi:hypothetical protein
MAVLCVYLMLLAKRQQPTLSSLGTGWEAPANVVNSIINGPGFYFGRLIPIPTPHRLNEALGYNGDRLLGVVLFWFLIGLAIERRLNRQGLDASRPIRAAVLFAFAALICGLFAYGGVAYVFCPSPYMTCRDQGSRMFWTVLNIIAEYPLRTYASSVLSVTVWLLGFCVYFSKRSFAAFRRSLASQT